MPIHSFRPLTPSGRFTSLNKVVGIVSKKRPERGLLEVKNRTGGRNNNGRNTSRHRGGGHKQRYRIIDFRRDILDIARQHQLRSQFLGDRRDAFQQHLALIGQREIRPLFRELARDAIGDRMVVGDPHHEAALALHQTFRTRHPQMPLI